MDQRKKRDAYGTWLTATRGLGSVVGVLIGVDEVLLNKERVEERVKVRRAC